jgi:hypothetical protein
MEFDSIAAFENECPGLRKVAAKCGSEIGDRALQLPIGQALAAVAFAQGQLVRTIHGVAAKLVE